MKRIPLALSAAAGILVIALAGCAGPGSDPTATEIPSESEQATVSTETGSEETLAEAGQGFATACSAERLQAANANSVEAAQAMKETIGTNMGVRTFSEIDPATFAVPFVTDALPDACLLRLVVTRDPPETTTLFHALADYDAATYDRLIASISDAGLHLGPYQSTGKSFTSDARLTVVVNVMDGDDVVFANLYGGTFLNQMIDVTVSDLARP